MLIIFRDFEKLKNQNKHEKVVDRKCFFYPVSCLIFREIICDAIRFVQNPPDHAAEYHRQGNPNQSPDESFFVRNCVVFFVENTQIQQQHNDYCNAKSPYQPRVVNHVVFMKIIHSYLSLSVSFLNTFFGSLLLYKMS